MKTAKILLIGVLALWTISCEKDSMVPIESTNLKFKKFPKTKIPPKKQALPKDKGVPGDAISLKFIQETGEDQMGKFSGGEMVVFNGKVWSVGGINSYSGSNLSNDVWASDNGKNWRSITSGQFEPMTQHKLAVFRDKIWMFGGITTDASTPTHAVRKVWYSSDGLNWVDATPTRSAGIDFPIGDAEVFNDKLSYVSAGTVASTFDGFNWEPPSFTTYGYRNNLVSVVFRDELYVIGGTIGSGPPTNDIYKSGDGVTWDEVLTVGPIFSARGSHTATVYNNKVWIIGGQDAARSPINDIWYSSDMINWQRYEAPIPIEAFTSHKNLVFDGKLWHFGGVGSSGRTGQIWSIQEE